jgi:hypothetical protein
MFAIGGKADIARSCVIGRESPIMDLALRSGGYTASGSTAKLSALVVAGKSARGRRCYLNHIAGSPANFAAEIAAFGPPQLREGTPEVCDIGLRNRIILRIAHQHSKQARPVRPLRAGQDCLRRWIRQRTNDYFLSPIQFAAIGAWKKADAGFFRIRARYGRHHDKGNDAT